MKKLFKALFKVISLLLIVFIILSVLVTVFVDINHYKTQIINVVEQQTGLKLEIKGELKLSIISGLKFKANDIKLLLDKELIADIESVRLGMTAYSLYNGEPEITSVDLALRTLKFSRNKKGEFNFLPLYYKSLAVTDSDKNEQNQSEKLALNSLALKDIQLSIENFQYLDDLSSVSLKLTDSKASLSILPIIDHQELVIDDPRILIDYNYDGELTVKKALINQYQISNLAMQLKDHKGDFIAQQLEFSFIEGGKNHALPPMIFDAKGKLAVKLRYHTPEGASEPNWEQPDVMKIGQFDFNLPKFELSEKNYQIKIHQTHLVFNEISVFEAGSYLLNELLIKSLSADSKKVDISLVHDKKNSDNHELNSVLLQLNNVPLIHKGKLLEPLSNTFLTRFSKKGNIALTSEDLRYDSQVVDKINVSLKGNKEQVDFLFSSAGLMDSSINAEGHFKVHSSTKKNIPRWQFKVNSDKLNLKTVSELVNSTYIAEGFSSIDTHLTGEYHNSAFQLSNARVNTRANNVLLHGININKILEDFQNSQSVGLLDVGAVVLMGPTGVLLTKGNDYNKLITSMSSKGNSKIEQLNLNMTLSDDVVTMNDVAFSTPKHRLAVQGKINIKEQAFIGFKAATIDKNGCPIYEEEVKGTLGDPKVKKVNILVKGIVNPINTLVKKISKPLKMQCKNPFYNGLVKAPVQ